MELAAAKGCGPNGGFSYNRSVCCCELQSRGNTDDAEDKGDSCRMSPDTHEGLDPTADRRSKREVARAAPGAADVSWWTFSPDGVCLPSESGSQVIG